MTCRSSHLQHQEEEERQDSIEISSELDDALNELGMLSSSSGAATGADLSGLNRKEFLKDKWRRGRYPLRREKEREICWSSSSSGSCCSSSGSSSRRSSSSSAGSGSFSSLRSCYTRSPLLSSYSIAETPTGCSPAVSSFASSAQSSVSTSSFGSASDMRMSEVVNMCMRSVDVVKVLRHRTHRPSPYNRRCSLNLAYGRTEPHPQRPSSSSSSGFYSPPVGGDSLILRSGLSDSEASSGSGTGTPPPALHLQQQPLSARPNSFNVAFFKTFSDNMNTTAETQSNPCSPEKGMSYEMKLAAENTHVVDGKEQNERLTDACNYSNQTQSAYSCSTSRGPVCPFASTAHVHCPGILSRSKSLDDLTSAAFVSEDSSSSTDFATGHHPLAAHHPPDACFFAAAMSAAPHHLRLMQQQALQPQALPVPETAFLRCCHAPIHHHSHHQLQSQAAADSLTQPVSVLRTAGTPVPSCDSTVYENVVHRMNQLEMN